MKELFERLPRISVEDHIGFLIDTCFFVWILEHNKQNHFKEFLQHNKCAITSFNVEEFVHIDHKINGHIRESARRFLHSVNNFFVLEISVHPGNKEGEHSFVKSVLPELDAKEHDPSDAVILAVAIQTGANVLTRDKHHIFNVQMENFLNKYDVRVLNKFS